MEERCIVWLDFSRLFAMFVRISNYTQATSGWQQIYFSKLLGQRLKEITFLHDVNWKPSAFEMIIEIRLNFPHRNQVVACTDIKHWKKISTYHQDQRQEHNNHIS